MKTLFTALLLLAAAQLKAPVTLAWDMNPELDLAGYRVYCRVDGGAYNTAYVPVAGRTNVTVTLTNLALGVCTFAVSAVSSNGLESVFSNEVSYTNRPAAPKTLHFTLQVEESVSPTGPWTPVESLAFERVAAGTAFYRAVFTSTTNLYEP
jgi:hypothetical protein